MPTPFQFIAFLIKHDALKYFNEAFYDPGNPYMYPQSMKMLTEKYDADEWLFHAFPWVSSQEKFNQPITWRKLNAEWEKWVYERT